MSPTLRNYLVIGLVVVAVAVLTVISQFTASPPPRPDDFGGPGGPAGGPTGPPLVFGDALVHYDPNAESIVHRSFAGYFEVGDTVHWVSFWFRNPNPFPVRLRMRERSCTSCTSARVAVVPPDLPATQAGNAATAALPWSPVPLPDLLSAVGYAGLQGKLAWHPFDFERRDDVFTVPAAVSPDRPTVGVLALGFTAKTPGMPKPVTAVAEAAGPDDRTHTYPFGVAYGARSPFDLLPAVTPIGDLPEGAPAWTTDVFIYSSTRGPGDLPPPVGRAGNDDPFLVIGAPVRLTPAEAAAVALRASEESKVPVRVESGYRIPVTVHRDVPGKLPDIGAFEKTAYFAAPGSAHTVTAAFRGRVTGLVKLESDDPKEPEKIALGSYNSEYGVRKTARIYTDRADLELELDPAQSSPTFVQYALERTPAEGSRKYWTVKITVPPKQGRKPAWEGVVYLKATRKDGARSNVRLPVSGSGIGR